MSLMLNHATIAYFHVRARNDSNYLENNLYQIYYGVSRIGSTEHFYDKSATNLGKLSCNASAKKSHNNVAVVKLETTRTTFINGPHQLNSVADF